MSVQAPHPHDAAKSAKSSKPTSPGIQSAMAQGLAGFTAGAVSTGILHPLDVIKTRFQINESTQRGIFGLRGTVNTFNTIRSLDGIKGLYRGLAANLAGSTLSWGFYFLWYDLIKTQMQNFVDSKSTASLTSSQTSSQIQNNTSRLPASYNLAASALAGATTCLMTNPFWLIKTRMCADRASDPGAYKSLLDGLKQTYQGEGVRGLYKGLSMSLVGVSHGAVQFMAYEEMKKWRTNRSTSKMSSTDVAIMSVSSKVVAMVVTYPYQVIRARIQNQRTDAEGQYRTPLQTIFRIYKGEGVRGFYKGVGPALIRVLPGLL
ncbi:mitochondrial carrier domain-containing protein [Obelidium mucronatum]|nr:mitochondrial carrier domain-containing protein [Obelidium mucronatum]